MWRILEFLTPIRQTENTNLGYLTGEVCMWMEVSYGIPASLVEPVAASWHFPLDFPVYS